MIIDIERLNEVLRLLNKLDGNTSLTIADEYTLTHDGAVIVGLVDIYKHLLALVSERGIQRLLGRVA